MRTVWLTHEQLAEAQRKADRSCSSADEVLIAVDPFRPGLWNQAVVPPYQPIVLRFRRASSELVFKNGYRVQFQQTFFWELDTPVQVVDEWIARQMQTTNE